MKEAKIFGEQSNRLVKAIDIKMGKESKNHQFVDPEYEFKVTYVNGAKNNGAPHFRLYLSHDDYLKLTPERKTKFDILKGMNHFAESEWHKSWSDKFSSFAKIEKYIPNPETKKYKRADVYYEEANLVIELQHSYISNDFVARNNFYSILGLNTIWLFDLTRASTNEKENIIEILEDNARGFFKVIEECGDLSNYYVYIQTKNKQIYRVKQLKRKEIENDLKSTIRYFEKEQNYSPEEFVSQIKYKNKEIYQDKTDPLDADNNTLYDIYQICNSKKLKSITVKRMTDGEIIRVYRDDNTGMMSENFKDGKIGVHYCEKQSYYGHYKIKNNTFYSLSKYDAGRPIWKFIELKEK